MGYMRRAQVRTVPRMGQCLRSLVLARSNPELPEPFEANECKGSLKARMERLLNRPGFAGGSMCGCPVSCKRVFERFWHVIGCGHVSGLMLRREPYRGPSWRYADQVAYQLDEPIALGASLLFLIPIRPIVCP